jgi:hypothetical protein
VANTVTKGLNETANDAIVSSDSVSYKLTLKYFDEITRRYAGRKGVLFWELGNELNLMPNLPPPWCGPTATTGTERCFDNEQMVAYTTTLVSAIRANDPVRPISSGYGLARSDAWHMEHCWQTPAPDGCKSGFWGTDTKEQWLTTYAYQNSAVDIWSAHHYMPASLPGGCFFSKDPSSCTWDASLIKVVAAAAQAAGKMLYVGEYGGPGPDFTGPSLSNQSFPDSILAMQVEDAKAGGVVSLTTIWAWACPSHRKDMVCIWPGSARPKEEGSDAMLQMITKANQQMEDASGVSSIH